MLKSLERRGGRPLHFDEYLQSLSFLKSGLGDKDLRFKYLFQAYSSSDKGLSREDLVQLLNNSLSKEALARPRAESRIYSFCKKHFLNFDKDKTGYLCFAEFKAFMMLENNFWTIDELQVDLKNISDMMIQRRRQAEVLEKLVASLMS